MRSPFVLPSSLIALLLFAGAAAAESKPPTEKQIRKATSKIDDAALSNNAVADENWLTYNGNYTEARYSGLDQITTENVAELQLVWSVPTGSTRALEATPIVVDGVMFTTAPWSVVFALDARTGKEIWRYDPNVPRAKAHDACCDIPNRGVAVYLGKVYVATLDGRLISLDAATGKVAWETATFDPEEPYTITGAPRIAKGKVLIGSGGAEYGVRGMLSAYDAKTGKLAWRTYTVPGDPKKPQESKALEKALETWKGADEWLARGAGGTAWDSITWDPELNQVYVGTGNGSAWVQDVRSPGGGDNLYLSSILALDANSGEVKWHYQVVPGDNWDFDACQQLVLADLEIDGEKRKVLMQAPKNGFYYVLDRKTGELLSVEQFADNVTWATKVDMKTGRPVEAEGARYEEGVAILAPSAFGAHNWQPMAYSPKTGLAYIPAQETFGMYSKDPDYEYEEGAWNTALDFSAFKELNRQTAGTGHLLAWDPVKQKEAWRAPYDHIWNGGTVATAGNLVFQGTSDGRFIAYSADEGTKLWEVPVSTGIIAGPMTYMVDGVQYVTVSAGWGGAFALAGGDGADATGVKPAGAVLTYALAGKRPPPDEMAPELVKGEKLYHQYCAVCHGGAAISGSAIPDLRTSKVGKAFVPMVLHGIPGTGMAAFDEWVSEDEAKLIHDYVRHRAEMAQEGR